MTCKLGHDHTASPVMGSTENPTQPPGGRPFHCPKCSFVQRKDTISQNWRQYSNIQAARTGNHLRACHTQTKGEEWAGPEPSGCLG
jgi:hypothetical protein